MKLGSREHLEYCAQQAESCKVATSDESLTVMDRVGAQIGELDWMVAIKKETETRFTPGPWTVHGAIHIVKFGEDHAEIATVLGPVTGNQFAGTGKPLEPWNERWAEGCANAQLIAAAPEMYAALKSLMANNLHSFPEGSAQKAHEALAKAEGRNV
jgi:hypothetical protein